MKQYKLITLFCFTGLLQLNAQTYSVTEQTAIVAGQSMPSVLLSFDAIINDKKDRSHYQTSYDRVCHQYF